jgi:translation elongation factor EF-Tu-like GTPase
VTRNPDLIARLTYFSIADGGRRTPAGSGHRPHTKFEGRTDTVPVEQVFADDKELMLPGESSEAEMTIIAKDKFLGSLYAGQTFEFFDGERMIGTGTILKVLNEELKG